MTSILLLGRGRLVKYLFSQFKIQGFSVSSLPSSSILSFVPLDYYDFIIDCLDPSSLELHDFQDKLSYLSDLRCSLLSRFRFNQYIYISSVNLYLPSFSLICESSPLHDQHSNPSSYISLKLYFEQFLRSRLLSLKVLRLPSLWEYRVTYRHSFFSDIANSRLSGTTLDVSENDQFVVTFMHYIDAAKQISRALCSPSFDTSNITSNSWSSRFSLKLCQPFSDMPPLRQGLRITSKIIPPALPSFFL